MGPDDHGFWYLSDSTGKSTTIVEHWDDHESAASLLGFQVPKACAKERNEKALDFLLSNIGAEFEVPDDTEISIMISQDVLRQFVALANGKLSYESSNKLAFHQKGRRILSAVAELLGLKKGEYEIRSNKGGIAVSGEITLHADWIYIQLSQSVLGPSHGFLYRTCKGQKDYTGGQNHFMKFEELLDLPSAAAKFARLKKETYEVAT